MIIRVTSTDILPAKELISVTGSALERGQGQPCNGVSVSLFCSCLSVIYITKLNIQTSYVFYVCRKYYVNTGRKG